MNLLNYVLHQIAGVPNIQKAHSDSKVPQPRRRSSDTIVRKTAVRGLYEQRKRRGGAGPEELGPSQRDLLAAPTMLSSSVQEVLKGSGESSMASLNCSTACDSLQAELVEQPISDGEQDAAVAKITPAGIRTSLNKNDMASPFKLPVMFCAEAPLPSTAPVSAGQNLSTQVAAVAIIREKRGYWGDMLAEDSNLLVNKDLAEGTAAATTIKSEAKRKVVSLKRGLGTLVRSACRLASNHYIYAHLVCPFLNNLLF